MKATLPADCAKSLGLEMVGDQAAVSVDAVNSDGSVEVTAQQEEADATAPSETPSAPLPGSSNPSLGALPPAGMGAMMGG